jgi:transcriptional regulator with XRE-family HTH domain
MITPPQIRAASALLRINLRDLARRAHVSVDTVRRLEAENRAAGLVPDTLIAVQRALEAAEAEFIPDGVRYWRSRTPEEKRARTPEEKEALLRDLMAIAGKTAKLAADNSGFTEDDLYDENRLRA